MEKSRTHKRASVWHIGDIYRLLCGTHHHAAVKVDADSCGETPCVVQLKHVWGLYGAMGQWGQGLAEPCEIFPVICFSPIFYRSSTLSEGWRHSVRAALGSYNSIQELFLHSKYIESLLLWDSHAY